MRVKAESAAVRRADQRLAAKKEKSLIGDISTILGIPDEEREETSSSAPAPGPELALHSTKEMKDHRRAQIEELIKNSPPVITPRQWKDFLDFVTRGVTTGDALETVGIPKWHFDRAVRLEPKLFQQWTDARTASLWMHWDQDQLDCIICDVMAGMTTKDACAKQGKTPADLYRLALIDPVVKQQYDEARKVQAEAMLDQMQEVADEDGNDWTVDGKGNSAAVNRSRLRVEAMQYRMEKMNGLRFGPRKNVEHTGNVSVDHVHLLEEGRRRVENVKRPIINGEVNGRSKAALPDPHRVKGPGG